MLEDFVWIQTRDGSPTLWNNSLGEPFRSVKGAFSESWTAFVEPSLRHLDLTTAKTIRVGEFGLGLGTNWLLMTAALLSRGLRVEYVAIERDLRSFELGVEAWRKNESLLRDFLRERGLEGFSFEALFEKECQPKVFSTLEAAQEERIQVDFWFHDPFGFSVNPEGYSLNVLKKCSALWSDRIFGVSYACNRSFKDALLSLENIDLRVLDLEDRSLKRSRLEFFSTL